MMKKLIQIVLPNLPLKLLSLLCGYALWSVIAQSHVVTVKREAPVCVYNVTTQQEISAPDTVQVTLQGARHMLYTLDADQLAVHVDANRLHTGDNQLYVDKTSLFLPEGINVVHYTPSNAVIQVEKIV